MEQDTSYERSTCPGVSIRFSTILLPYSYSIWMAWLLIAILSLLSRSISSHAPFVLPGWFCELQQTVGQMVDFPWSICASNAKVRIFFIFKQHSFKTNKFLAFRAQRYAKEQDFKDYNKFRADNSLLKRPGVPSDVLFPTARPCEVCAHHSIATPTNLAFIDSGPLYLGDDVIAVSWQEAMRHSGIPILQPKPPRTRLRMIPGP